MSLCEKLGDYLDRRLPPEVGGLFEAHLHSCDRCRQAVDSWQGAEAALKAADAAVVEKEPSHADALHLMARAAAGEAGHRPNPPVGIIPRWALATACATLAAGVIVWVAFSKKEARPYTSAGEKPVAAMTPPIASRVILRDGRTVNEKAPSNEGVLEAPEDGRLLVDIGKDRVGLKPASRMTIVRARGDDVVLKLLSGTVACEVSPKSQGRAFVVESETYRVKVVGTRFSVRQLPDEGLAVAVESGIVEIRHQDETRRVTAGKRLEWHRGVPLKNETLSETETAALAALLTEKTEANCIDAALKSASKVNPSRSAYRKDGEGTIPVKRQKQTFEAWQQAVLDGRHETVEAAIIEHLKGHPGDAEARELLADCQRKAGRWESAVASYLTLASSGDGSRSTRARFIAATLLQDELRDCGRAKTQYVQYLESPPGRVLLRESAELRLAQCLLTLGKSGEAKRLVGNVLVNSNDPATRTQARQLMQKIDKSGD